jgi:hypothetical protein
MFCRSLRNALVGRWILVGLSCVALVVSVAASAPIATAGDGSASISLRTSEFPLAALERTSPVRLPKQAQTNRAHLPKPDRNGQPSLVDRARGIRPMFPPSHTSRALPRRFLPSRHFTARGPSDSSEPFLATSLLS